MYALIDCNNFYASCERLFRPDLRETPIIILSNNDGCVIARSNEAKALGIQMGVPFFKVKGICDEQKVQVFSSNYTLYGDLSHRVMTVIEEKWPHVEIYSIDEAFLNLASLSPEKIIGFCENLQKAILKQTGIPTSIGIGATKTLAKIANHMAKKVLKIPVFKLEPNATHWLSQLEVGDIWGIGRQWCKQLNALGIFSALDLAKIDPHFIKKRFNVVMQQTVLELNGTVCLGLNTPEPKQCILSSRSFGSLQNHYIMLQEGISHHCGTAWAKMRQQGLMAQYLSVFIRSNPFRHDLKQYSNSLGFKLVNPTDDVRVLTHIATSCLKKIFKEDIQYYKCGVLLGDLIPKTYKQMDLFHQPSAEELRLADNLMKVIDDINKKYGPRTMKLASEGLRKPWRMKRQMKTPNYTTSWSELPTAFVR